MCAESKFRVSVRARGRCGYRMITIFGAPGSGKTTQVLKLKKSLVRVQCEVEPTEGVKELIHDVYERKAGAVYKLQSHILEQRVRTYELWGPAQYPLLIADGHIVTDFRMFVVAHIKSGALAGEEKEAYLEKYHAARRTFEQLCGQIDMLIYLKVSGATAANRVKLRSSSGESGVDEAVFSDFAERAEKIADQFNESTLVVIDAEQDEETIHSDIMRAIDRKFCSNCLRRRV